MQIYSNKKLYIFKWREERKCIFISLSSPMGRFRVMMYLMTSSLRLIEAICMNKKTITNESKAYDKLFHVRSLIRSCAQWMQRTQVAIIHNHLPTCHD